MVEIDVVGLEVTGHQSETGNELIDALCGVGTQLVDPQAAVKPELADPHFAVGVELIDPHFAVGVERGDLQGDQSESLENKEMCHVKKMTEVLQYEWIIRCLEMIVTA